MTSRHEHYTPQPYDPYAEDEQTGVWFNSDGYIPQQPQSRPPHEQDYGQRYEQAYQDTEQQPYEPAYQDTQHQPYEQSYQRPPGPDAHQQPYLDPTQQPYVQAYHQQDTAHVTQLHPYQQQPHEGGVPEQPDGHDDPGAHLPQAAIAQEEPPQAAYHVPETPEAGWDDKPSRRRDWVSRGILLVVLAIQAVLSLRLSNTAFQDEALYLSAGHNIIDHWTNGTPLNNGYEKYFSGAPTLYPVAAAFVDGLLGLTGARLLSLACMLGSTALLYSFTRRLFNERVALAAAALFAVTQPSIVLGFFATYDAPAIFLLALSAWIIVRTGRAPVVAVLLAAPVMVLAVAVKYASALYLPTLVVLAALTAWHHRGWACVVRAFVLGLGTAALVGVGLLYTDVLAGVRQTTTNRQHGTDSTWSLIEKSAEWGGLMFATAVAGSIAYVLRGRMNESPRSYGLMGPGWRWRAVLGLVLTCTALLAPAYQIRLHTAVSLYKHLDFGLLFAAPMAGVGVIRLVGKHFRYPQLGILIWVSALCLGVSQSEWRFGLWPDSSLMARAIEPYMKPNGHYLGATYEVPTYYLRDKTSHSQWSSTYGFGYSDKKGRPHEGREAYSLAIKDGYFDLILLDGIATPDLEKFLAREITDSGNYRLIGRVPYQVSGGTGFYQIWAKSS
ncbi:glycosyltransferase family 39 protein [Streptomyces sp. NPDC006458]|uniref:glycosyltransferase family 39 protein n=1 Tax=Streptomyces sp. NPDC006458 TaxID=3154302 RepID=UPI0033A8AB8A